MIIYSVQRVYTVGIKFCVTMEKKKEKKKKKKVALLNCVTVLILLVHCMPCSKNAKIIYPIKHSDFYLTGS